MSGENIDLLQPFLFIRFSEVRYRIDQRLMGAARVPNHICTTQKIPFLYLGYWIDGASPR